MWVSGVWTAPEPATVVLNYPASFSCVSRGEADITWSYNGNEVASTSSDYSDSNWLTIATFKIGKMMLL